MGARKQKEPGRPRLALPQEPPGPGRKPALPRQKEEQELALKLGPLRRRR